MTKFLFLIPALLLISCKHDAPRTEAPGIPVNTTEVELFTPKAGERYSASIVPYRQVTTSFRVNGVVDSILKVRGADGKLREVGTGDTVTEGAVLAQLRQKDYELHLTQATGQWNESRKTEDAARSQAAQAEVAAAKARTDFDRARALFEKRSLTKPEYDGAKAQFDAAQAQLEAARSQIAAVSARASSAEAAVGSASLSRDDTVLKSPIGGVVVQRHIELGSIAGPAAPAFSIVDLSSVKALFGVPDMVVVGLRAGRALPIAVEALSGQPFRGVITAISPVADANTRLFQVEVSVSNARHILRPGMIATLSLETVRQPDPLPVVPLSAIVRDPNAPDKFSVMVVSGNAAKRRAVTLAETYGTRIGIASGLRPGERVVSRGAATLPEGARIEVIP